jgi:hypothetical protein
MSSDQDPPDSSSLSGMIATLAPVAVISGIYIAVFLILRKSQRRYYAPRTYLGSLREGYAMVTFNRGLKSLQSPVCSTNMSPASAHLPSLAACSTG